MSQDAASIGQQPGPDRRYAWPRFWLPSDGFIDLSDAGFLRNPAESLGPPNPAQLAALQNWRALALLGEPGIGKSTILNEEADRTAALPEAVSVYVDLRDFYSETLLHRRLFESEKFIGWKNGTSQLFLHLDSLDEVLLRIDSIANLLASELSEVPAERISIRIACRTAVWPADTLGAALKRIWGDKSGVFVLAPLRRKDVVSALDANDIEVEGFMRALFAAHAVAFAIKPLTRFVRVTG
jgi:predicted NACHT family NTPase